MDSLTTQQTAMHATFVSFGTKTKSTKGHESQKTFSTSSTGTYSPRLVLNMFFLRSTILRHILPVQSPISPVLNQDQPSSWKKSSAVFFFMPLDGTPLLKPPC